MKDDTISRAAAIDAVNNMIRRKFGISADLGTGALLELPSATDTNVDGNLIDRQAALDALGEEPPVWYDGEDEIAERNQWRRDVAAIKALPSAQPTGTNTVQVEDCISREAAIDGGSGT